MSFAIHGLGTATPPDALTSDDGLRLARFLAGPDVRTSTWLIPVYTNSGVTRRYQVIGGGVVRDIFDGEDRLKSPFYPTAANEGVGPTTDQRMKMYAAEAGPLALRAARQAVAESGFAPDSFTHLVTVSCTGFVAPGVDLALIRGLGLRPTVERTHVGFMGCHGALNGLRVANAFASAAPGARVLVAAVELCSLHYYYGSEPGKLIANAIFADGAAAVAGTAAPRPGGWALRASGSCLIPESDADMGWVVGDHGFEMTLSRRVPGLIAAHLRPWLEGWLRDNGLSLADVGCWAVHPGGPKILVAVEEALGLPRAALAASRAVFADRGNMSSPTVLFVLDHLRKAGAAGPCVALGFGPGLVAEAALFG
ncbi:type III polyketide synthase [bacterium]|nr:type III polyketide synthase [bacterium]